MQQRFRLRVDATIRQLVPSLSGVVLYVEGLQNGPSDAWSDGLLSKAERKVRGMGCKPAEHPHMRAWADVYRAFGARPKCYKNGCLALARRETVPRINALVDAYNAVALQHMLPVGGEDWDRLESDLVRTRATGQEPFLGNQRGSVLEHPPAGEPVWRDRAGVTTRRFNWRQSRRTCIDPSTRAAYFVFDAVAPYSLEHAQAAACDLRVLVERRWRETVCEESVL